jgi:hypothetical protein
MTFPIGGGDYDWDRKKVNELIIRYGFNDEQARLFLMLSKDDRHALLTWCMQGRAWANSGKMLPAECYAAITSYLVGLTTNDAIDFYTKIAFSINKASLVDELQSAAKFSFSKFNFFSSDRLKAEKLLPLCEAANNLQEMRDILDEQEKGSFYKNHVEQHHNRCLSI